MNRYNNDGCFIISIFYTIYALSWIFIIIELISLPFVYAYNKGVLFTWIFPILLGITTIFLITLSTKNYKYKKYISKLENEYQQKKKYLKRNIVIKTLNLKQIM